VNAIAAHALVWVPVAAAVAPAMDGWAALLHRVVWHGRLWSVHRSHHAPRRGSFERNDALSLLHAPAAIVLVLYGCAGPPGLAREVLFGAGIGMTAFGIAYLLVHDGLVHARLPVRFLVRLPTLRAIVDAHRRHHASPAGGPPYGLFFGPRELRKARASRDAEERIMPSAGSWSPPTTPGPPPTAPRSTDRERS
jgi:beta-carotene 3-hydroxylase